MRWLLAKTSSFPFPICKLFAQGNFLELSDAGTDHSGRRRERGRGAGSGDQGGERIDFVHSGDVLRSEGSPVRVYVATSEPSVRGR